MAASGVAGDDRNGAQQPRRESSEEEEEYEWQQEQEAPRAARAAVHDSDSGRDSPSLGLRMMAWDSVSPPPPRAVTLPSPRLPPIPVSDTDTDTDIDHTVRRTFSSHPHLHHRSQDSPLLALDPSLVDHLEQRPPRTSHLATVKKLDLPSLPPITFRDHPPFSFQTIHPSHTHMPHRVEPPILMSVHDRRNSGGSYGHYQSRPSPPPIATLTQSPSLSTSSLDRSSVSSPAPGRRSPLTTSHPTPSYSTSSYYPQTHPADLNHNSNARETVPPRSYSYNNHQSYDHRREPQLSSQTYPPANSYPHPNLLGVNHGPASAPYLHSGHPQSIVYTNDANTKLNDRTRRRCFNCCSTDTSTWRRSNLNPGKVLCNKCGLFERTHNRSRPDQFPHRRGPLASSSLRDRTPPSNQLPPISSSVHALPPYHYNHPSIAPLASVPDARRYHAHALPEIQSWHEESTSASSTVPMARRDVRDIAS